GYGTLRINVGQTKNWGFETDLKAQIIKTSKFSWDVNVRYAYNNNKIISLYKDVPEFFQAGFSYAGAFLMKGLSFPQMKAISYVRDSLGRIVVNGTTGYPLNNGPLKTFGRTTPPHILGLGSKVRYNDLQLSFN